MKFQFEEVKVNNEGVIIQRHQRKAEYFSEDLGGGITLDMVSIPGGTFMMGSPAGFDSGKPQHRVSISPFFLGKFAVTQAQWEAVAKLPKIGRDLKPDPSVFISYGVRKPVERVCWVDAMEFCARLSRQTGKDYRLPSEAEWEYACRAGTTTLFHFGETITTDLANYNGEEPSFSRLPRGIFRGGTTEVGSFPPNAFGLYDMHGNVWEWCADCWHENYDGAPNDGSAWKIGGNKYSYCLRGGSWSGFQLFCYSGARSHQTAGESHFNIGFRVALSPARTV